MTTNRVDRDDLTLSVMFPSNYLACPDLKGRHVTITISGVSVDEVPMTGGKKSRKCVVCMAKTPKKLIVGKTNGYALGVLVSPHAREWIGKRITLCPDVDMFGGKQVPAIRIAGSPDAAPERAAAYASAWRGERQGGRLCGRLKRALGLLELGVAPPVEPEEHEEAPVTEGELAADAAVDDVFSAEADS